MIIIRIPIRKIGIIPSVIEKKIISKIPVPFESPFLGEFNTGSTLNILFNPIKLIEKINSKMT